MRRVFLVAALLLVLCFSAFGAEGYADINTAKYAVLSGSTNEEFVRKEYPDAEVLEFSRITDCFMALESGKVDYVVTAKNNANQAMKKFSDMIILENVCSESSGIAIKKGNDELRQKINAVIGEFKENGRLQSFIDKWTDVSEYPSPDFPVVTDGPVLNVAISADREPMCFVLDGQYAGSDIEMIYAIAYELGMKIKFQNMDFSSMIVAVSSGKCDLAVSNISITETRKEAMDFSDSYAEIPVCRIARKLENQETEESVSPIPELNGKPLGVLTGSILDGISTDLFPDSPQLFYSTLSDLVIALKTKKIDGFLYDLPTILYMENEDKEIKHYQEILVPDFYGWVFSKTEAGEKLRAQANEFLAKIAADGTKAEMEEFWFSPENEKALLEIESSGPNGTLDLAVVAAVAPFAFIQDTEITGYEIDMVNRFCKEYGYGLEINDMDFAAVIPSVISGKNDFAACTISYTEERAKSVLFSDSDYTGGVIMVVRAEDLVGLYTPREELISRYNGKTAAVRTGTIFDAIVSEIFPDSPISYYSSQSDEVLALKTDKADFNLGDLPYAMVLARDNPEITYEKEILVDDNYGYIFNPDEKGQAIQAEFNTFLSKIKADGTYDAIKDKWFNDANPEPVENEFSGSRGTITLGTDGTNIPFCFSSNNTIQGFDIEVISRFCKEYDYGFAISVMDFAGLIPSVVSGKIDIGASTISITEERKKSVLFSDPVFEGGVVMIHLSSDQVVADSTAMTSTPVEKESFWSSLKTSFRRNFIDESRWKLILSGLWTTVIISVFSAIFGTILGFGICMLRRSRNKVVSKITSIFILIVQGLPIVVLLMILYYVIFGTSSISPIIVAILGFSINFAAYVSEMMRTGIEAVDHGQIEAANALGFNQVKTFAKITFPQAAKHFLPVFKGEFISMVKMTSVVGYIAIQDLTKVSDIIRSRTYEAFFPLISTAVIYFIVAYIFIFLLGRLEFSLDPKSRSRTLKGVQL